MFMIFAGDNYYPAGGWRDFRGLASTIEEALEMAACQDGNWWHISDGHVIVKSGQRGWEQ